MNEQVRYLTPEGKKRIEEELERLKTVERQAIADALRRAIEEGDLSENFGYSEAKRQQAMVEGRILELTNLLKNAQLVEMQQSEVVALGSTVTIAMENGMPETYRIVGPAEVAPSEGRISNESPLGKALMGHRVGDKVQVKTPSGTFYVEILSIA